MYIYLRHSSDQLFVARRTDLRYFDPSDPGDRGTYIPVTGLVNTVIVDYDPVDGYVFWSDVLTHSISKARLDGTGW